MIDLLHFLTKARKWKLESMIARLYLTQNVSLLIYKPNYSWPGLIIVATGVPVYLFWSKRSADSTNNL